MFSIRVFGVISFVDGIGFAVFFGQEGLSESWGDLESLFLAVISVQHGNI
jgi:hypothetical protein